MNTYNLNGARVFDGKFPFDSIVILKEMLSNVRIIVDAPLVVFQKHIVYSCFSIVGYSLPFQNERNIKQMSQKNTRAPRLAFSTVEIVDLIESIVVASLSSMAFVGGMIEGVSSTHSPLSVANIKI